MEVTDGITWERQDRGWYTSRLGAITHERQCWVFIPVSVVPAITFRTLREAKAYAAKTVATDGNNE